MTRRHFYQIAAAVQGARVEARGRVQQGLLDKVARNLALECRLENRNFQPRLFFEACGVDNDKMVNDFCAAYED